jgi:hypothetical protein
LPLSGEVQIKAAKSVRDLAPADLQQRAAHRGRCAAPARTTSAPWSQGAVREAAIVGLERTTDGSACRSHRPTEKDRPASRTAFPVSRRPHIKRAISEPLLPGAYLPADPDRVPLLIGTVAILLPDPSRWFPISVRWVK